MIEITPSELVREFAENPTKTLADPSRRAALIVTGNEHALDTVKALTAHGWDEYEAANAVRAAHAAASEAEFEANRTASE